MTQTANPRPSQAQGIMRPVIMRLQHAGPCSPELLHRVTSLAARLETQPAKTVLQKEDAPVVRPRYLVSGWACRYRLLADGRRQIFDVVLPGEGVGVGLRSHPLARSSTAALTTVRHVDASSVVGPDALASCAGLCDILQRQADAEERRALNHIVRLGRMTALERTANIFIDLLARFTVIGEAEGDRFPLPVTQETLSDIAGLSVVHINRTLQELRRQGLIRIERGWLHVLDKDALVQLGQCQF